MKNQFLHLRHEIHRAKTLLATVAGVSWLAACSTAQPETGFIGRGHELLALQRLLRDERYVVVRGQGGEGKAALAASSPAGWSARTGFVAPRSSQSRCTAVSPRCLMPSAASTCRVTPWPCSMMWNKGLKTSTASDALRVSAGSALIVVAGRLKTIN